MLDLPLHVAHGPAPPLPLAWVPGQVVDQDEVPQAHPACRVLVLGLAAVVGLTKCPQPTDMRDLSTPEQHQMEASKSFLQMRPVQVSRMS